jgi:hypothetical protein
VKLAKWQAPAQCNPKAQLWENGRRRRLIVWVYFIFFQFIMYKQCSFQTYKWIYSSLPRVSQWCTRWYQKKCKKCKLTQMDDQCTRTRRQRIETGWRRK